MISYKVYNQKGEAVSEVELPEKVFGLPANEALVHQAAVAQMANQRQVLAHTKDRSEVRGGGKKPWKQKGTGRARAGSSRSPIWIGGGVTFGPTKDRNFSKGLNLKMKRKALCIVLSDKVASKRFAILDELAVSEFKTKLFRTIVENVTTKALENKSKNVLVVDGTPVATVKNSARNLPNVKLITVDNINIIDLLKYQHVIVTNSALKTLEKRYNK